MTWISVNDKLPEYGTEVIIISVWEYLGSAPCASFPHFGIGYYCCAEGWKLSAGDSVKGFKEKVTHWMPLPKGPE